MQHNCEARNAWAFNPVWLATDNGRQNDSTNSGILYTWVEGEKCMN